MDAPGSGAGMGLGIPSFWGSLRGQKRAWNVGMGIFGNGSRAGHGRKGILGGGISSGAGKLLEIPRNVGMNPDWRQKNSPELYDPSEDFRVFSLDMVSLQIVLYFLPES